MLDAPEALFLDGGDQGAVLDQAGGGVGVVGVEAKDVGHQGALPASGGRDRGAAGAWRG